MRDFTCETINSDFQKGEVETYFTVPSRRKLNIIVLNLNGKTDFVDFGTSLVLVFDSLPKVLRSELGSFLSLGLSTLCFHHSRY